MGLWSRWVANVLSDGTTGGAEGTLHSSVPPSIPRKQSLSCMHGLRESAAFIRSHCVAIVPQSFSLRAQTVGAGSLYASLRRPFYTAHNNVYCAGSSRCFGWAVPWAAGFEDAYTKRMQLPRNRGWLVILLHIFLRVLFRIANNF